MKFNMPFHFWIILTFLTSLGMGCAAEVTTASSHHGGDVQGDTADRNRGDQTLGGDRSDGDTNGDVSGDTNPSTSLDACSERSALIRAIQGTTIMVTPEAKGRVLVNGSSTTLRQVVSNAAAGDVILLQDGTYTFLESDGDSYTGLYFTEKNVVMRSVSGDPDAVILDSAYADHGGQSAVITVAASGVVLADFTVKRSIFHLIHLWGDGDEATVHNVRMYDAGQQFLKSSPGNGATVDGVKVTCSEFIMTSDGRDNVWGYGAQNGGTTCYTGGIDTHDARNWLVADNKFEGIYCNPAGVQRPLHGKKGSIRNNSTYTGGLSEYAIHMWDSAEGSAHTIERNVIVNCARGIGIGMAADVYGTMVRNNMIFSEHSASVEHDVGIHISRAHDISLFNNTVFFSSPQAYPNAIEYRYNVTSGVEIRNNLVNQRIRSRNSAAAVLSNNLTDAKAVWFADVVAANLHLAKCDIAAVAGMGMALEEVKVDLDGQVRAVKNDIGADQCVD